MQLVLTEDQELLAKTAADFVAEKSPVARLRGLRDAKDETGFAPALWKEMAELGWVGIPFAEKLGGADMGVAELAVVLEALGRRLAPEPFVSSVLLAGQALRLAGSESQQQAWLPDMIEGHSWLAGAIQGPRSRYDLFRTGVSATADGDGYRLDGEKVHVQDGFGAKGLLVSARTDGEEGERSGVTLFMLPGDAAGLTATREWRLDSRNGASLRFDGVRVAATDVVGRPGEGAEVLERAVDYATAGLCAEMLGGMSQAFEDTLEYLKEREQFDAKIGSFQALKHRAAEVFIEIELARSTVMAAARALDADDEQAARLVSLAKARCSEAYMLAANEGVQMFGGVGMTDEYDIGLYMKQARASELTFGDAAFHRDRWARLAGY
ncbi:MAG: acyl-CoA dehydrogenase family protein [Proteobacteria bacterium]|nr:acyl-CoA dehydrogenase family protein [Pseudomonadota bacterium]